MKRLKIPPFHPINKKEKKVIFKICLIVFDTGIVSFIDTKQDY